MLTSPLILLAFMTAGLTFAPFNAAAGPLDSPGAQKAMVCSACHGFAGNSPGNTVPIIAGMAPTISRKRSRTMPKENGPRRRWSRIRSTSCKPGLTTLRITSLCKPGNVPQRKPDPNAVKRGAALAGQCAACHGPNGEGDAFRAVPAIHGQPAGYLQLQLTILKENKRKLDDTTVDEAKKTMLKPLSEADLAGLAAYFSSLK